MEARPSKKLKAPRIWSSWMSLRVVRRRYNSELNFEYEWMQGNTKLFKSRDLEEKIRRKTGVMERATAAFEVVQGHCYYARPTGSTMDHLDEEFGRQRTKGE